MLKKSSRKIPQALNFTVKTTTGFSYARLCCYWNSHRKRDDKTSRSLKISAAGQSLNLHGNKIKYPSRKVPVKSVPAITFKDAFHVLVGQPPTPGSALPQDLAVHGSLLI